jgi:hypothetical protein
MDVRFKQIIKHLDQSIRQLNSSKIFAGMVVVILNILTKYVDLGLSASMKNYLKHRFSRIVMVAAILWMGSRDIYISIGLTTVFVLMNDVLFHEDSRMCIIPEHMKQSHKEKVHSAAEEDSVKKAKELIEFVKKL